MSERVSKAKRQKATPKKDQAPSSAGIRAITKIESPDKTRLNSTPKKTANLRLADSISLSTDRNSTAAPTIEDSDKSDDGEEYDPIVMNDLFKSCHSTAELLSLDNPMAIIESAFEQNVNEKLECINEKCLKEFADAKSYLAHARRCGIMRRHSASSRADSPETLKKRNSSAKRETPKYYSNYAEYRGRASCWAVLPTLSKMKLIKNELDENPTKRLACLNPNCMQKLSNPDKVLEHVNHCFLPEYFLYLGRVDEFRRMDKKEQNRLTRAALNVIDFLPCLNIDTLDCSQVYSHSYGLWYHLQKCGVNDMNRQWKCYRCGETSVYQESKDHLIKCHQKQLSKLIEKAHKIIAEKDASTTPLTRSAKKRRKTSQLASGLEESDHSDECAMDTSTQHDREEDGDVGDKDDLLTSLLKSTRCRGMASVSQGVLPTNSSRTSINAGVKRYKFKTTESLHRPSEADSRNYQAAVNSARVSFDADRSVEQLCRSLLDIHFDRSNWDVVREEEYTQSKLLNRILNKHSVPVRLPGGAVDQTITTTVDAVSPSSKSTAKVSSKTEKAARSSSSASKSNADTMKRQQNEPACEKQPSERLRTFTTRRLPYTIPVRNSLTAERPSSSTVPNAGEGCVAYCGGPIATISSCPRLLENDDECVVVSVFPDEEYLIDKSLESSADYLQFWRYNRTATDVSARLWFLMELSVGTVLTTAWCPLLRGKVSKGNRNIKNDSSMDRKFNFIGFLAVGGTETGIAIYGIPNEVENMVKESDTERCVLRCAQPDLLLNLPEGYPQSPVVSLAWSEVYGAAPLAAVFASGHVAVWDMNNPGGESAKIIYEDEWSSPPMHVAFTERDELAISFREKCVRVYDVKKLKCIIEENAPRSAGMKVASFERLFPGPFCYQGDCISTSEFLDHTMCYITKIAGQKNFFVVPLALRHEVRMWDMAVCPQSGAIYSVGADGRLEVCMNGRIVPRNAKVELIFNCCRVAMTLIRKQNPETIPKDTVSQMIGNDIDAVKKSVELSSDEKQNAEDGDEASDLKAIATDLDSSADLYTIEFSFDDAKHFKKPIDLVSLDIRVESLNRIAVSQPTGKLAICGGEAGLLIYLPCEL